MKKIKILVVEDDPAWGGEIKAMYEAIFDDSGEDITRIVRHESHGRAAHEFLQAAEPGEVHLLSLDINLGLTHPRRQDGSPEVGIVGACGIDLLKLAAAKNACRAVIIITGAGHDETIRTVTRNKGELAIIDMSLDDYVRSLFPDRYKLLRKAPAERRPLKDQIQYFKTLISPKDLLFLCRPNNEFVRERTGVWRLRFAGKTERLQERDCLSGLKLIQHLLKYPNQEFTALALQRFEAPGESRETTEGQLEVAKAFEAGLVPGRTGFERLPDERGPSKDEINNRLDSQLQEMRQWSGEYSTLQGEEQYDQSVEALGEIEKVYNEAMALAKLLHREDAIIELRRFSDRYSLTEYWQTLLESTRIRTNDEAESSSDTNRDKQRKSQFQKTLPQQAQDAIARAVKQALKKINECHSELHEHLRFQQGIRIGTRSCVYSPKKESEWILENE